MALVRIRNINDDLSTRFRLNGQKLVSVYELEMKRRQVLKAQEENKKQFAKEMKETFENILGKKRFKRLVEINEDTGTEILNMVIYL